MRGPDTDDYKKLVRVMKYIQGTIDLPLILSIDKSGNIKWYVDASFAVHKDMRSHTGGFMTMETGGSYVYIYLVIVGLHEGSWDVCGCYLPAFRCVNHTR